MARALGMNPRKLPGLRPGPQQGWKLPVGEFIERLYRKQFGATPRDHHPRGPERSARKPSTPGREADVSERVLDPEGQVSNLVCYLSNLADDLQMWLAHGSIDSNLLPQVREELAAIVDALAKGLPISPLPEIPVPPRPSHPRYERRPLNRTFNDDENPF